MKGTGTYVPCENCGKIIYKTQYQYKRHKHHYCSNKCQSEKKHKETFEFRKCEVCGKPFECSKLSSQRFCSNKCQNEWQKTRVGLNNPRFDGGYVICETCGQKFLVNGYNYKADKHHFCSNGCRRKWFSDVYSQQEWYKELCKNRAIKMLNDGSFSTTSSIQIKINNLLDKMGISYINEFPFIGWAVDNYLNKHNLIIENNGDFWHCNPNKYKEIRYKRQYDRIVQDAIKQKSIEEAYGAKTLYLWECDIDNNIYMCEKLIKSFVESDGNLPSMHSIHYEIVDDKLVLKKERIVLYQEMNIDELEEFKFFEIAS